LQKPKIRSCRNQIRKSWWH